MFFALLPYVLNICMECPLPGIHLDQPHAADDFVHHSDPSVSDLCCLQPTA